MFFHVTMSRNFLGATMNLFVVSSCRKVVSFSVEVTADYTSGEVTVKQLGANSSALDGIELEKGIVSERLMNDRYLWSKQLKKPVNILNVRVIQHFFNF